MESYYLHKLNKYKSKVFLERSSHSSGKRMNGGCVGGNPHLIEDIGLLYLFGHNEEKEKHQSYTQNRKNDESFKENNKITSKMTVPN